MSRSGPLGENDGPRGRPRAAGLNRRGFLAGGAATGAVALGAGRGRAAQEATPEATPVTQPTAAPAAPRAEPAVPGAAGGGVPRVVPITLDELEGAAGPAPDGLELVAALDGPILVGVAVSAGGRIFLNWPRWGDPVEFTVGELRDGQVVPYPDAAVNRFDPRRPGETFVSVQAIGFDAADRLWILDTGSINFQPVFPGGPKLVAVDLATDTIVETIPFPLDVVRRTSSINDLRFDLGRGSGGIAYITDAAPMGPNGIVTVDLGSGRSWRRLNEHPSVNAEPGFIPTVEGEELLERLPGRPDQPLPLGADGIAISADGSRLFYTPLASRTLYAVDTEPLAAEAAEEDVAATVADLGTKGSGTDGLETDAEGRIYLTQYERNAIARRTEEGEPEPVVEDGRLLWPDTMALAGDGFLYFTANQLHRQPRFHDGLDLRRPPYAVLRVAVDGTPVRLG